MARELDDKAREAFRASEMRQAFNELSTEGILAFWDIRERLTDIGGRTAEAADVSALLMAKHAEVYAGKMREQGREFSALDYVKNISVSKLDEYGNKEMLHLAGLEINKPDAISEVCARTDATQAGPIFCRSDLGAGLLYYTKNLWKYQAFMNNKKDVFEQAAWHGSPHDFSDFDLNAIGTGEGAQAHGWGLYFAQDRKIADGYRSALTHNMDTDIKVETRNGRYEYDNEGGWFCSDNYESVEFETPLYCALDSLLEQEGDIEKAVESIQKSLEAMGTVNQGYQRSLREAEEILLKEGKEWKFTLKNPGALFQAEIPEDDVLLDEQKTLNEQPEKVREAIEKIKMKFPELAGRGVFDGGVSGRTIYTLIAHSMNEKDLHEGTKEASKLLNEYGVKGISYVGEVDGRCFVVFDDKAISILDKFEQMAAGRKERLGITQRLNNGEYAVTLMRNANETTFIHEMSHIFLMDTETLAQVGDKASQEDLKTVHEWAQWHEGDAKKYAGTPWEKEFEHRESAIKAAISAGDEFEKSRLLREWEHERFARGFEMYLGSGKAPTRGLKRAFERCERFIKKVYHVFRAEEAKASPEVEKVMARMIAGRKEKAAPEMGAGMGM